MIMDARSYQTMIWYEYEKKEREEGRVTLELAHFFFMQRL